MVRRLLVCLASLVAVLALAAPLAGCSESDTASEDRPGGVDSTPAATDLSLIITRDYGATVLKTALVEAGEATDVMHLLTDNAEVESKDGFVTAIEGVAATESEAWFYWVDGLAAEVGAADYKLQGGETVWWDLHRWDGATFAGTAVHAFPVPWAGRSLPLVSDQEFAGLEDWAEENGLQLGARRSLRDGRPDDGLVVCTAAEAAATPWLVDLLSAKDALAPVSVDDGALRALDMEGTPSATATAAAVALPNAAQPERPLLLLVLADAAASDEAFDSFTPATLRGRLAVAVVDGAVTPLPLRAGS